MLRLMVFSRLLWLILIGVAVVIIALPLATATTARISTASIDMVHLHPTKYYHAYDDDDAITAVLASMTKQNTEKRTLQSPPTK